MRKARLFRLGLYVVGILLAALEIKFHWVAATWDKLAIRRVRVLAQYENNEYHHSWLGVEVLQYPSDLIAYQELVYKIRPDVFVEAGTFRGGLTLFLAEVMHRTNPGGRVITIDLDRSFWDGTVNSGKVPKDLEPCLIFIEGDSTSAEVVQKVTSEVAGKRVMVLLDSMHTREHVLKELNAYSPLVSINSYLIVNDTHTEDLKVERDVLGRGPLAAVKEFLRASSSFEVDSSLPQSYLSCAPGGFLRRVR